MNRSATHLLLKIISHMPDMFKYMGERTCSPPKYSQRGEEGFIVETIAWYEPRYKSITFNMQGFYRSVKTFKIPEEYWNLFLFYILMHEFCHYVLDMAGFYRDKDVSANFAFDEPFCEYIALKTCLDKCFKVFNYKREINFIIDEEVKKALPVISSLPRPAPYNYFRELYGRAHFILRVAPEDTLIRITKIKLYSHINPEILLRCTILVPAINGKFKVSFLDNLDNIGGVELWVCNFLSQTTLQRYC
ncbi:MAG: hypothetical protein ACTSPL_08505 [Candidatus Odinarchaeia archaeon]